VNPFGGTTSDVSVRPALVPAARYARVRVGRLIGVRADRLGDIDALTSEVTAAILRAGPDAVLCADYRRGSHLLQRGAGTLSHAMRVTNEYLLRSALLVDPRNTMFNLQVERVVRCAGHAGRRRIFTDAAELREWLVAPLTGPERDALDAFLSGDD
jgi:hypothetical protein